MKKTLSAALLIGSLTLGNRDVVAGEMSENREVLRKETDITLVTTKANTALVLDTKNTEETDHERKVKEIISETIAKMSNLDITEEMKQMIISILGQSEFRDKLYALEKKEKIWSLESIIMSLILGFLYGWAYFFTIRKIRDKGMPIDAMSFSIFAGTSGMMAVLNGFVPGSLVYMESFVLASASVYLHMQNKRQGIPYKDGLFENFPWPVIRYNKDGCPLIWNKQMENEIGYNFSEVMKYYREKGEVTTLLFKGENLEKVQQLEANGEEYMSIPMTTKSGEEKTFPWTVIPSEDKTTTMYIVNLVTDTSKISTEPKQ